MGRYNMSGLQMYGGDDLGAFMSGEDVKESLMAVGAGAVGVLATGYVLGMLPADMVEDPVSNSRLKSVIALGVGILGGRAIHSYNRDLGMAFVGAVGGNALAAIAASWAPETFPNGTALALAGGGIADADLAALSATVATNSGAYQAPALSGGRFGAPNVAQQTLMGGFGGTETASEEIAAYSMLMNQQSAPPPSF